MKLLKYHPFVAIWRQLDTKWSKYCFINIIISTWMMWFAYRSYIKTLQEAYPTSMKSGYGIDADIAIHVAERTTNLYLRALERVLP